MAECCLAPFRRDTPIDDATAAAHSLRRPGPRGGRLRGYPPHRRRPHQRGCAPAVPRRLVDRHVQLRGRDCRFVLAQPRFHTDTHLRLDAFFLGCTLYPPLPV
eukprot:6200597-Pleurochrysis_carterae.AAC.3